MTLEKLIELIGRLMEEEKIRYFTFGAVAMDFWVSPRMTHDLDLVLCVEKKEIPRLATLLNGKGFQFSKSLQRKLGEGRIVNLPIGTTKLDLKLCATDHDRMAADRATEFESDSHRLWVATPEDVVLYKLQVWRRQDQADIERLKKEVVDLDEDYIHEWITTIEAEGDIPMLARWESV